MGTNRTDFESHSRLINSKNTENYLFKRSGSHQIITEKHLHTHNTSIKAIFLAKGEGGAGKNVGNKTKPNEECVRVCECLGQRSNENRKKELMEMKRMNGREEHDD